MEFRESLKTSTKENCFPKDNRLLSKKDFEYLKEGSFSIKEKFLALYYKDSRISSSKFRLGLSVSKKVGNAHLRNRYKRLLKESFRKSGLKDFNFDGLFVVSPFITRLNEDDREKVLLSSFQKVLKNLKSNYPRS